MEEKALSDLSWVRKKVEWAQSEWTHTAGFHWRANQQSMNRWRAGAQVVRRWCAGAQVACAGAAQARTCAHGWRTGAFWTRVGVSGHPRNGFEKNLIWIFVWGYGKHVGKASGPNFTWYPFCKMPHGCKTRAG